MKAAVCEKYGPPSVAEIKNTGIKEPGPYEVLIKIAAATVTAGDIRMRSSDFPLLLWIPARIVLGITAPKKKILGHEFSGTVVSRGEKVTLYKPGDRVFGTTTGLRSGSHAEYITMPEKRKGSVLSLIPEGISFKDAAAVPIGGMASLDLLLKGNIETAEKVMVLGACGSVGSFALKISRIYGTEVTAVCSHDKVETATKLGADNVIDYTREPLSASGQDYDLIFDSTGKYSNQELKKLLSENGKTVSTKSLTSEKIEYMDKLKKWMAEGKLKPFITKEFRLDEIVKAHEYAGSGHKSGNVLIRISPEENE